MEDRMRYYSLWLALVCILAGLIQIFSTSFTDNFMLTSDALIKPWQFITAIFLHGSVTHLLFNLFALLFFGLVLEKFIGSRNFIILFFFAGIIANLVTFNFYPASLGASGAILGLIGCLAVIRPMMVVWTFNMPMPMFAVAIVWIGASVLGIFGLGDQGTGYIAHLAGVLFGIIFELILRLNMKKVEKGPSYSSRIVLPEEHMQKWENFYLKKS